MPNDSTRTTSHPSPQPSGLGREGGAIRISLPTDFESVQAHYDLSNEFFAQFLDESMTYSCAKFDGPDMSLRDAQLAKIDYSLDQLDLRPGMRLLDVGCGWGATAMRARERF